MTIPMVMLITFMVEKIMLKASSLGYIVVLKHYHDLKFTTKLCLCCTSLAYNIMYDHCYSQLKTKFFYCTILYLTPIWNVQGGIEIIHMFHTLYFFLLFHSKISNECKLKNTWNWKGKHGLYWMKLLTCGSLLTTMQSQLIWDYKNH